MTTKKLDEILEQIDGKSRDLTRCFVDEIQYVLNEALARRNAEANSENSNGAQITVQKRPEQITRTDENGNEFYELTGRNIFGISYDGQGYEIPANIGDIELEITDDSIRLIEKGREPEDIPILSKPENKGDFKRKLILAERLDPDYIEKMKNFARAQDTLFLGEGTPAEMEEARHKFPLLVQFDESGVGWKEFREWYDSIFKNSVEKRKVGMRPALKDFFSKIGELRRENPDIDFALLPIEQKLRPMKSSITNKGGMFVDVNLKYPDGFLEKLITKVFTSARDCQDEYDYQRAFAEISDRVIVPEHIGDRGLHYLTYSLKGSDLKKIRGFTDTEKSRKILNAVSAMLDISLDLTVYNKERQEGRGRIFQGSKADAADLILEKARTADLRSRLYNSFYRRVGKALENKEFAAGGKGRELTKESARLYTDSIAKKIETLPQILVHGDFHAGNIFEDPVDESKLWVHDFRSYWGPLQDDLFTIMEYAGVKDENKPALLKDIYEVLKEKVEARGKTMSELGFGTKKQFVKEDYDLVKIDKSLGTAAMFLDYSEDRLNRSAEERKEMKGHANTFYAISIKFMRDKGMEDVAEAIEKDVAAIFPGIFDSSVKIDKKKAMDAIESVGGSSIIDNTFFPYAIPQQKPAPKNGGKRTEEKDQRLPSTDVEDGGRRQERKQYPSGNGIGVPAEDPMFILARRLKEAYSKENGEGFLNIVEGLLCSNYVSNDEDGETIHVNNEIVPRKYEENTIDFHNKGLLPKRVSLREKHMLRDFTMKDVLEERSERLRDNTEFRYSEGLMTEEEIQNDLEEIALSIAYGTSMKMRKDHVTIGDYPIPLEYCGYTVGIEGGKSILIRSQRGEVLRNIELKNVSIPYEGRDGIKDIMNVLSVASTDPKYDLKLESGYYKIIKPGIISSVLDGIWKGLGKDYLAEWLIPKKIGEHEFIVEEGEVNVKGGEREPVRASKEDLEQPMVKILNDLEYQLASEVLIPPTRRVIKQIKDKHIRSIIEPTYFFASIAQVLAEGSIRDDVKITQKGGIFTGKRFEVEFDGKTYSVPRKLHNIVFELEESGITRYDTNSGKSDVLTPKKKNPNIDYGLLISQLEDDLKKADMKPRTWKDNVWTAAKAAFYGTLIASIGFTGRAILTGKKPPVPMPELPSIEGILNPGVDSGKGAEGEKGMRAERALVSMREYGVMTSEEKGKYRDSLTEKEQEEFATRLIENVVIMHSRPMKRLHGHLGSYDTKVYTLDEWKAGLRKAEMFASDTVKSRYILEDELPLEKRRLRPHGTRFSELRKGRDDQDDLMPANIDSMMHRILTRRVLENNITTTTVADLSKQLPIDDYTSTFKKAVLRLPKRILAGLDEIMAEIDIKTPELMRSLSIEYDIPGFMKEPLMIQIDTEDRGYGGVKRRFQIRETPFDLEEGVYIATVRLRDSNGMLSDSHTPIVVGDPDNPFFMKEFNPAGEESGSSKFTILMSPCSPAAYDKSIRTSCEISIPALGLTQISQFGNPEYRESSMISLSDTLHVPAGTEDGVYTAAITMGLGKERTTTKRDIGIMWSKEAGSYVLVDPRSVNQNNLFRQDYTKLDHSATTDSQRQLPKSTYLTRMSQVSSERVTIENKSYRISLHDIVEKDGHAETVILDMNGKKIELLGKEKMLKFGNTRMIVGATNLKKVDNSSTTVYLADIYLIEHKGK